MPCKIRRPPSPLRRHSRDLSNLPARLRMHNFMQPHQHIPRHLSPTRRPQPIQSFPQSAPVSSPQGQLRAGLVFACSGLTFDRPAFRKKKAPDIPNGVRAVSTAALSAPVAERIPLRSVPRATTSAAFLHILYFLPHFASQTPFYYTNHTEKDSSHARCHAIPRH
jgi:hypothetical protein